MIDRRAFLRTGAGLFVAFGVPRSLAAAQSMRRAGKLGGPYKPISPASLDSWLAIAPDGSVTVFTGRTDSGQGKATAFAQFVADELDVAFESVAIVMGDTGRTPDQGASAASDGMARGVKPLRHAAAEARRFLLNRAAIQFGVAPSRLGVRDGIISVVDDPARSVSYGALIGGKRFDVSLSVINSGLRLDVTGLAELKDPSQYRVVGRSVPRTDIGAKVAGIDARVQNVRVGGMLHGRIVVPSAYGATLLSLDRSELPDSVIVVRKGDFVGVVASTEWAAIEGARKLKLSWSDPRNLAAGDCFIAMRSMPAGPGVEIAPQIGDPDAAYAGARKTLEATYDFPVQNHGMIGPCCAVVDVRRDEVTVWSGTQDPGLTRDHIARLLRVPLNSVRLIWQQTSGCYGRMTMDDAAAAAALLSAEVGKPVRVQLMREEEHAWSPQFAPFSFSMRAGLDKSGRITVWDQDVWTWGLGPQIELPWILEGSAPPSEGRFAWVPIGGGDVQAYTFANQRSVGHPILTPMVRCTDMRSPGILQANFANECFIDELAFAADADPIAFRLRHTADPRTLEVLKTVAEAANWAGPLPSPGNVSRGRGVSVVSSQKFAWLATIAEVDVDRTTGHIRLVRMVVAVDVGLVVNPDGLRNQIEGGTLYGASRALKEEVKWDASGITTTDWNSYPILRFSEVPDVTIKIIKQDGEAPGGIGEAPNTTPAAAIANAVFHATGARLRRVPFTPARVLAALNEVR